MVTFVNIFLVIYSDTAVAFFGAYFKIQQLIVMTVNGLIQGCLPIMRYNFGAKQIKRLNQAYKNGSFIAVIMMLFGMLLVLFLPKEILKLFSASETMLSFGVPAMRIMAIGFVFNGLSTMIATYTQATERIVQSIIIQLSRQCILLFPLMWVLNYIFKMNGIWISFPITEIIVFIVATVMLKRNK